MRIWLAPVLVLALAACGSDTTGDTGTGGSGDTTAASCHVTQDGASLVLACPGKDDLRIDPPASCTLDGQVLTCPGGASVTIPGSGGCVIASSSPGAITLDCDGVTVPVRYQEVGTLTGVARLYGADDASVITVKVVGDDSLTTHPAADGTVEWKDIPAGIFDLEVSADGFYPQTVRNVTLVGGSYDFGTVQLYRTRLVLSDASIASVCGGQGSSLCQAPSGTAAIVEQNGRFGALTYESGDVQWMLGFTRSNGSIFSPGEGYFYDNTSVWDLATGTPTPFRGPVAFSADDRLVARRPGNFGSLSELRYLDLADGSLTTKDIPVTSLLGTADGFLLGNATKVFVVKPGQEPQAIGDYPGAELTLGPDLRLATVRNSAGVFGVDLRDPSLPSNQQPISTRVYDTPYTVAFAPAGRGISVLEKNPNEQSAVPVLKVWDRWGSGSLKDLGLSGQTAGTFSPDGAWLAFYKWTGNNVLMLFDMQKANNAAVELSKQGSISKQQFDPRSKRLVWVQRSLVGGVELGVWELGVSTKLTALGSNIDSAGDAPFTFSPDGKYMAYAEKVGSSFRLMLADFGDLAHPTELLTADTRPNISFTPDSKALVFGTQGFGGPLSVLVIGQSTPVDLGQAVDFRMTADGSGVVFVRTTDTGNELVLWHRATGDITPMDAAPQFQLLDATVNGKFFYVRASATDARPNGIYELPLPSAG